MTDMTNPIPTPRSFPNSRRRRRIIQVSVAPRTIALLAELAATEKLPRSQVVDRAVDAYARERATAIPSPGTE